MVNKVHSNEVLGDGPKEIMMIMNKRSDRLDMMAFGWQSQNFICMSGVLGRDKWIWSIEKRYDCYVYITDWL